ncbi:MAG: SUMF1/EgtB/PvdO family nonheme iron enzyme [Flavobacteriales bacterium]|nr:SUMF1/EgtB/PvdO family nonheme iron enzyme [Flavobacteriales bacterium]
MNQRNLLLVVLAVLLGSSAFTPRRSGKPAVPKAVRKQYLEVPAGEAFIGGDRIPVGAFFLSCSEVTNIAYREYLADLKRIGDTATLAIAIPDTAQWNTEYAFQEPLRLHYFSHPAYANYPVVNVSQQAAEAYCIWLAGKLNAIASEGTSYAVRLPSRAEWVLAAQGGLGRTPYSWGGPYTRNSKGCFLANYRAEGMNGHIQVHDNAFFTAPVESYFPNGLGLYCMNGNVAEWLQETGLAAGGSWRDGCADIRNESVAGVSGPAPTVGFRPLVEVRMAQ